MLETLEGVFLFILLRLSPELVRMLEALDGGAPPYTFNIVINTCTTIGNIGKCVLPYIVKTMIHNCKNDGSSKRCVLSLPPILW